MMTDDLSLRLITWNVGDVLPPKDLTELLNLKAPALPNVYAIGLQELNASPGQVFSDSLSNDPWTNAITKAMVARNYLRLKTIRLVGMHLSVYVRKPDLIYVNNVEATYTRTGIAGFWGNKGGVSIRLDVCGVNMCIVNCHLTPHLPNVADRMAGYDMIIDCQRFKDTPTILDHDYVFWMGDLNFRLDKVDKKEVEERLSKEDYESLWQYDQLQKLMKEELILVDFKEQPLNFPCTYKYDKKTNVYDTSDESGSCSLGITDWVKSWLFGIKKQRKPGWCDRVLWLSHDETFDGTELGVTPKQYTSIQSYCNSDHKPVVAEFNIKVLRCPPMLPVMFEPLDQWCATVSGKCVYTVARDQYKYSTWDWVGLYKSSFAHPLDYITWVWAPSKGEDMGDGTDMYELLIDSSYLSAGGEAAVGMYCLCYYSSERDCIVGCSDMFKISLTEESSSSDESVAIGAVGGADTDSDPEGGAYGND